MKLFDAHCHLLPPEAVERAAAAGVAGIAVCGTSPDDWAQVFKTLELFPQIFPMVGIHPWFVKGRDGSPSRPDDAARPAVEPCHEEFQTLEKLLREYPGAGIGETGLDFQDKFKNRAEQEASFAAHLDLARELNRPVAVHCVQAWGRLIELLREHPAPRVLLHAFSGAPELISELTGLNCWFSFGSAVMNPRAKRAMVSAAAVSADRLLIETDSSGEPEKLIEVARAVAELRKVPVEEVADLTFSNAGRFFKSI